MLKTRKLQMRLFRRLKTLPRFLRVWRLPVLFRNATHVAINSNPSSIEISEIQNYIDWVESDQGANTLNKKNPNKIVWVVPQASEFGGGFRTISRFLRKFDELGIVQEIHVYQPIHPVDLSVQQHLWHGVFGVPRSVLVLRSQNASTRGAFVFATGWQTIFYVIKTGPRERRGWFQQDEESLFHVPGALSLLIEQSYREFDLAVTAGPWLAAQAIKKGIKNTHSFDFGSDEIYFSNSSTNTSRQRTMVAYFQASKPWRASFYMIEILKEIVSERPNWRVQIVGDDYAKNLTLPKNFLAMGVLTPVELSYLYAEASIGVCLSLSNASLVPYEMISSGLRVVTNSGENNSWLSKPTTSNLTFADLEYVAFKKAVIDMIDEIDKGLGFCQNNIPTWGEILENFVNDIRFNPKSATFADFFK